MAITFDSSSYSKGGEVSSLTWSHTCTGSDLVLVVGGGFRNSAITITGITYGGVAMTQSSSGQASNAPDVTSDIWYLANPATGANNIVASFSSSTNSYPIFGAVSLTGCDTSSPVDTSGINTGTGSSISKSITTSSNNSYIVDFCKTNSPNLTVADGQTERSKQTSNAGDGGKGGQSTKETTAAGSYTMSWTVDSGERSAIATIAIKASSTTANTTNFFQFI